MADNAEVNSGSGITVATDQIGSAHYQLFKLVDGSADSTVRILGDTAGLRVQFSGNNPALSGTAVVSTASGVGISGTAVVTITGTALISTASGVGISGTAVVTITGTALVSTASGIGISGTAIITPASGIGISGTALITPASGLGISGTVLVNPVAISGTVLVNPVAVSGTVLVNPVAISGTAVAKVAGDVSASATDAGNPIKIGGVARITNPAAVADAQRVNAAFDDVGRQLVYVGQPRDLLSFQHTAVATAAETTAHVLGGAGVFLDLAELVLTNAASVAATVTIKDSFGGQTALIVELAPVGGIAKSFVRPIPQRSANQAWSITLDTAVTVYSTMLFEKNV